MDTFVLLFVIALYGVSYSAVEGAPRIINGTAAIGNMFPYMVSLQELSQVQNLTRGHRCGGALLTLSHALTAASCIHNNNSGVFTLINSAEYRLFAASVRLDNDNNIHRVRQISRFVVNPGFVANQRFINDIAIIVTNSPFSSITVTPLKLPVTDIGPATHLGTCASPGWGAQNATATASYQLMYTRNQVVTPAFCTRYYFEEGTAINWQSSFLCGRPTTESSGCAGDLGNPFVCDDYLTGVLFLTRNCSQDRGPDVYTKVFSYRGWLNETIFDAQTDGASSYQPGIGLLIMFAVVQMITSMS